MPSSTAQKDTECIDERRLLLLSAPGIMQVLACSCMQPNFSLDEASVLQRLAVQQNAMVDITKTPSPRRLSYPGPSTLPSWRSCA